MSMETKIQFIAGIDGGGTKTTVICQNLNGEILAEKRFATGLCVTEIDVQKLRSERRRIGRDYHVRLTKRRILKIAK